MSSPRLVIDSHTCVRLRYTLRLMKRETDATGGTDATTLVSKVVATACLPARALLSVGCKPLEPVGSRLSLRFKGHNLRLKVDPLKLLLACPTPVSRCNLRQKRDLMPFLPHKPLPLPLPLPLLSGTIGGHVSDRTAPCRALSSFRQGLHDLYVYGL